MQNINLTPIIQVLIALLAAIITYRVIPWIQANTTIKQQALIRATVQTLVFAAEQLYGAGNGSKKLEYVKEQLAAKGFDIDRAEIEAAVYEAFNSIMMMSAPSSPALPPTPETPTGAEAPEAE